MIQTNNPILTGFNPDPSIIRVGPNYYLAVSTFEWFPGVRIYHSTDLVSWTLAATPLDRVGLLNLIGVPDSCGVWAPCLSYHQGTFYLVYTIVYSFDGVWKDTDNYVVTAEDISGPWSERTYLHSRGFDPSLFHDTNGQSWLLSMVVDHRKDRLFGGIIAQEYDKKAQTLIGPVHHLFAGTTLGCTEGPHIYKRNGYYYLLMAEGGTEYGHAVSLARSRTLTGPYTVHPNNPILSSRDTPRAYLQKAGHGDLVETPTGDTYIVFLVGRPLTERGQCPLGRETAIAPLVWKSDDWLYPLHDNSLPPATLNGGLPSVPFTERLTFDHDQWPNTLQSLRQPISPSWASLTDHKGHLRLYGRQSLTSTFYQSLLARRLQHFDAWITTHLLFEPTHFQQMAGLITYYNTGHYYYLHLRGGDHPEERFIDLITCVDFLIKEPIKPIPVGTLSSLDLGVRIQHGQIQFFFRLPDKDWTTIGPELPLGTLSDDFVQSGERYRPAFTGTFIGLCCQDLTGQKLPADFAHLHYEGKAV